MCYLYAYTQFCGPDHLSNDRKVSPSGGPASVAVGRASRHTPGPWMQSGVRGSAQLRDLTVGALCESSWKVEGRDKDRLFIQQHFLALGTTKNLNPYRVGGRGLRCRWW